MKIIDMHCDTILGLLEKEQKYQDVSLYANDLCVDIQKLKAGDYLIQNFALFTDQKTLEIPEHQTMKLMDMYYRMLEENQEYIAPVLRYDDIERNAKDGKLSAMLTLEDGGVVFDDLAMLRNYYRLGVRMIALTWNYENCIGSPNSANRKVMRKGLKPFGIETVRRMNELGMIVDVSHLSDGGFYDCVKYSEFPIVASHSNARSLCLHPRNLTDEMLRLLGNKGGVAGVNFYSAFLRKEGRAEISDIVKHILYMIDKAGEDAVALGTDFDGFSKEALPGEIRDVEDMWKLWERLERAGLTGRQIEKFASGNILRVMNDVLRKK